MHPPPPPPTLYNHHDVLLIIKLKIQNAQCPDLPSYKNTIIYMSPKAGGGGGGGGTHHKDQCRYVWCAHLFDPPFLRLVRSFWPRFSLNLLAPIFLGLIFRPLFLVGFWHLFLCYFDFFTHLFKKKFKPFLPLSQASRPKFWWLPPAVYPFDDGSTVLEERLDWVIVNSLFNKEIGAYSLIKWNITWSQ